MSYKYNPNLTDLKFIKCPLCDKDIVDGRWHGCKPLLHSDEYVNKHTGVQLLWKPATGWWWYVKGNRMSSLQFAEVVNLVKDTNFKPVGNWQNPKAVKNIY